MKGYKYRIHYDFTLKNILDYFDNEVSLEEFERYFDMDTLQLEERIKESLEIAMRTKDGEYIECLIHTYSLKNGLSVALKPFTMF